MRNTRRNLSKHKRRQTRYVGGREPAGSSVIINNSTFSQPLLGKNASGKSLNNSTFSVPLIGKKASNNSLNKTNKDSMIGQLKQAFDRNELCSVVIDGMLPDSPKKMTLIKNLGDLRLQDELSESKLTAVMKGVMSKEDSSDLFFLMAASVKCGNSQVKGGQEGGLWQVPVAICIGIIGMGFGYFSEIREREATRAARKAAMEPTKYYNSSGSYKNASGVPYLTQASATGIYSQFLKKNESPPSYPV